jgi:hypothetical protein
MGMGQQHAVQLLKFTIGRSISELLPETRRNKVVTIKSLQWWQQAHRQGVKQASAGARLQVLLIELFVSFVWKAKVEEQPPLSVFEEYLVAADFVDAAVKCQPDRFPPPIMVISLYQ